MRRRVDDDEVEIPGQSLRFAAGAPAAGSAEFEPRLVFAQRPFARFEPFAEAALRIDIDERNGFTHAACPGNGEMNRHRRFPGTALLLGDRYNLARHGTSLSTPILQCCSAKFERVRRNILCTQRRGGRALTERRMSYNCLTYRNKSGPPWRQRRIFIEIQHIV